MYLSPGSISSAKGPKASAAVLRLDDLSISPKACGKLDPGIGTKAIALEPLSQAAAAVFTRVAVTILTRSVTRGPSFMGLQGIEWVNNRIQLGTCQTRRSEKVMRVETAPHSGSRVLSIQ